MSETQAPATYKGTILAYHAGNVDVTLAAESDELAYREFNRWMDKWEDEHPTDLILRDYLEAPDGKLIL